MSNVRDFYDELAADYHRLFRDWDAAVDWQAEALSRFIGTEPIDILDCACGIGTQAIGLALAGHRVSACDLSPVAAGRARTEARRRGARLASCAADMRRLPFRSGRFDVVLCADNSIAHLLTSADVLAAFTSMRRVLAPQGRLVLTMRGDYAQLRAERRSATLPQVSQTAPDDRTITFQLWHWHHDGEHYDFEHVQLHEAAGDRRVNVRRASSWAMSLEQVGEFATQAGFTEVTWHDPADSGYYQAVLTARA